MFDVFKRLLWGEPAAGELAGGETPGVSKADAAQGHVDALLSRLHRGDFTGAFQVFEEIRSLHGIRRSAGTARAMAMAYECFIDAGCEARALEPGQVTNLMSHFCSLMNEWTGERGVQRAYSTMALTVSIYFASLRDDAILGFHLGKLEECRSHVPDDEEIVFKILKGLVNLTLVRTERLGDANTEPAPTKPAGFRPDDPILGQILDLFKAARTRLPDSPEIADACGRFQHATGYGLS